MTWSMLALLLLTALAAVGGLGVFAVWWSRPANEARRLLADAPEKRILELAEGDRARVRGIARRGGELKTSPVTQRRCIGYRLVIQRMVDGFWRDEGEWVDCAPFEMVAEGAVARVEGPVLMGLELDTRGGDERELTQSEHKAIRELARSEDYLFTPRFRFREAILQDGDPIWVRGLTSLSVDPRGTRESTRGQPVLPVIRGTVQDPVILASARGAT